MLDQDKTVKYYTGHPAPIVTAGLDALVKPMPSVTRNFTQTNFPYIEIAHMAGGARAVIRGTRIPVSVVIGYLLAGATPETIVREILPQITLGQVMDALLYYYANRADIDRERVENTEQSARQQLRDSLDEDGYRTITGA